MSLPSRAMRVVFLWAVIVGLLNTLVYALVPVYGNTGLWIAVAVFLGLRGILLHLLFPALLRTT